MEELIRISILNDFIFCPRSIYYHNIFDNYDESLYHTTFQTNGKHVHKNVDKKKYSSKSSIIQGIDVFNEELGITGKIDLFDLEKKELIERKNKIKTIYEGYYLQLFAQYFCLIEMGYEIKKISFYSLSDNKKHKINLPTNEDKERLKEIIDKMNSFNLEDKKFSQNPNKCAMCIYRSLCDYYKNDE